MKQHKTLAIWVPQEVYDSIMKHAKEQGVTVSHMLGVVLGIGTYKSKCDADVVVKRYIAQVKQWEAQSTVRDAPFDTPQAATQGACLTRSPSSGEAAYRGDRDAQETRGGVSGGFDTAAMPPTQPPLPPPTQPPSNATAEPHLSRAVAGKLREFHKTLLEVQGTYNKQGSVEERLDCLKDITWCACDILGALLDGLARDKRG